MKELEEWECSVSRTVVVEVGLLSANRIRDVKTDVFCKRVDCYTKRSNDSKCFVKFPIWVFS